MSTGEGFAKSIQALSAGVNGLEYTYFNQQTIDYAAIHKSLKILGSRFDHHSASWNEFEGGICFGLSTLFLGCNTPKGRLQWKNQEAVLSELREGVNMSGKAPGILKTIAQAFVAQKVGQVVDADKMQGYYDKKNMKEAYSKIEAGRRKALDARVNDGLSYDYQAAIRDTLLANYALTSTPKARNVTDIKLTMAKAKGTNYKNRLDSTGIKQLVNLITKPNTYSLVYAEAGGAGHEMAAVSDERGCFFFDPEYGAVRTSKSGGMKTFLERAIPCFHMWDPEDKQKKPSRFMTLDGKIGKGDLTNLSVSATVYQYTALKG